MKKAAKLAFLGLIAFQWVTNAWLGIMVQELTPPLAARYGIHSTQGALISRVQFNSPAMNAGLKEGDLVISLNHKKVSGIKSLKQAITGLSPGTEIEIVVQRNRRALTLRLVMGTTPRDQA